MEIFAFS